MDQVGCPIEITSALRHLDRGEREPCEPDVAIREVAALRVVVRRAVAIIEFIAKNDVDDEPVGGDEAAEPARRNAGERRQGADDLDFAAPPDDRPISGHKHAHIAILEKAARQCGRNLAEPANLTKSAISGVTNRTRRREGAASAFRSARLNVPSRSWQELGPSAEIGPSIGWPASDAALPTESAFAIARGGYRKSSARDAMRALRARKEMRGNFVGAPAWQKLWRQNMAEMKSPFRRNEDFRVKISSDFTCVDRSQARRASEAAPCQFRFSPRKQRPILLRSPALGPCLFRPFQRIRPHCRAREAMRSACHSRARRKPAPASG